MESLYWVFTLVCNDTCGHCYNDSSPSGERLPTEELLRVVPNLPAGLRRVVLSGGEPTAEMDKLEALCQALCGRYGSEFPLYLQTNGDLLDEARLARVLAMGIDRIDVTSMDRHHKQSGAHRRILEERFLAAGLADAGAPGLGVSPSRPGQVVYAFWGATEELWLQGNWARGRALDNGHAKLDPGHNFCALWSGARGFLDDGSPEQELHVQLSRLYPCCPTSYWALGDVREEPLEEILARYRDHPDWQALGRGEPVALGREQGLMRAEAEARIEDLGDVCLWCDEYLRKHYRGPRGEARREEHRTRFDV